MSTFRGLPIEGILSFSGPLPAGPTIGQSRSAREISGFILGSGPLRVSLIGGCHADEPVGPDLLERFAAFLASRSPGDPLLDCFNWRLVPHANPDGRQQNDPWTNASQPVTDHMGDLDRAFMLDSYLHHVTRELPGDDIEFGFPHHSEDAGARPENRAVAAFLTPGAPYHLHGSFHGMGLAPGPWFLIEEAWIDRTERLRDRLRRRVSDMGYRLFDPDRRGEKGFRRIDQGFSTRPDSRAMKEFFERRSEPETASRFRPSSMEFVRDLGGDPLTFVTEMPLFLTAHRVDGRNVGLEEIRLLRARLEDALATGDLESSASGLGIRPMPIRDQQRLQLATLDAALEAVIASR